MARTRSSRTGEKVERLSKSARTRARIVDAAAQVLSRNGYAASRLTAIAEVAELQGPTIYYHFKSLDDVIEEVMETGQRQAINAVAAALEALPTDAPALDRILAAVAAHLRAVLTTSQYASASIRNMDQLPEHMRARQLELRREYGATWREMFETAAANGQLNPTLDPHAARMFVIGALNWAPEWWEPGRGAIEDIITSAQDLVRHGLERP